MYKPLLFILGAVSVLFVVWLSHRMDVVGVEHNPILYSWRLPIYWAWLVWQILIANLQVAAAALKPAGHVRPQIVEVPVSCQSAVGKVTYANSITLTPGTVTLLLEQNFIRAHALLDSSAAGLKTGQMEHWVRWLEGSK